MCCRRLGWLAGWHLVSPSTQAKFELVTSEASYIRSLTIAVDHFMLSQELAECLGAQDKQWLFSKLPEVKDVSERWSTMLLICLCRLQVFVLTPQLSCLLLWVYFLLPRRLQVSSGPGAQAGGRHSAFWCVRHRPGTLPGSPKGLFTLCNQPGLPGADIPAFAVSNYFPCMYNKSSVRALNIYMYVQYAAYISMCTLLTVVHKVQLFHAGCP